MSAAEGRTGMGGKAMAAALAAALGAGAAGGCSMPAAEKASPAARELEARIMVDAPTERHVEIARDLGCAEETLSTLREGRWPNWSTKAAVTHAELILDRLSERYGEEFKAKSISIPQLLDDSYRFRGEVESGPYAGTGVSAQYVWANQEEPFVQDSYIETLRDGEYKEYLRSIVREVYAGTEGAKGVMEVDAGGEYYGKLADPYAPIEEYVRQTNGGDVELYFPPDCSLSEEEYYGLIGKLKEAFEERGANVVIGARVITELVEGAEGKEFSLYWARNSMIASTEEHPTYKWEVIEHAWPERE